MAKVIGQFGDGSNTLYDISLGFSAANAVIRLFDLTRASNEVFAFQAEKQVPDSTSVRFTLTPAPPLDAIHYSITDGTEAPDSSP